MGIRAAFSVAVSPLEYIRENPFRDIKADRLAQAAIRYVSPNEFAALVKACRTREDPAGLWREAFLTVCFADRLRFGEALHLNWPDIDFGEYEIAVASKSDGEHT